MRTQDGDNKIDEAMLPFFEYVQKMSAFENTSLTDEANTFTMCIDSVDIETPFELDIQFDDNGLPVIGAAPPLYHVETSIEPVFHSMKIALVRNETIV